MTVKSVVLKYCVQELSADPCERLASTYFVGAGGFSDECRTGLLRSITSYVVADFV